MKVVVELTTGQRWCFGNIGPRFAVKHAQKIMDRLATADEFVQLGAAKMRPVFEKRMNVQSVYVGNDEEQKE